MANDDDARVQVLSTSLVHANNKTTQPPPPYGRIPLTPCDLRLLLVGTIQKGLLFRKPAAATTTTVAFVDSLKSSFSAALALFYPFAGRLSADEHPEDGTATIYIDCNDAGAPFAHASAAGVSVADILDPVYIPSDVILSFFPLNWLRNYHGFEHPLAAVQVTELSDGVFVGWTISHAVADGATIWKFVKSWSALCRGDYDHKLIGPNNSNCREKIILDLIPLFDNYVSSTAAFSRNWFIDEKHRLIKIPITKIKEFEGEGKIVFPQLKERVLHFSRRTLEDLKTRANAEADGKISSLQSLISHLWRAVIRNKNITLDPDSDQEEAAFVVQVGFRSRFVPEDYFGNAVITWPIVVKLTELSGGRDKGLGRVAAEVNKVVAGLTDEKLKGAVESWIENPKMPTLRGLVAGGMALSSSPRFDVYGNDFGWGKPVAVRNGPRNKFDG
ncbi:unnamed protein product [Linum tenue]|uniref:HXXXD-type acyl-transferase family protein n=1 Tax=Linum tenue TaxID=586396 RepID=A0AAV0IP14_9ROSI|nr:unnamed protein product [Linum tenue]